MLTLRSNLILTSQDLPLTVYTVGTERQPPITRLHGFSAKQVLLTLNGHGQFRCLGEDKWDILAPGSLLFIPDSLPHEYMPQGTSPWHVGYVTYLEKEPGISTGLGYEHDCLYFEPQDTKRIYALIEKIWQHSGPDYDRWVTAETMFALLMEMNRQTQPKHVDAQKRPIHYRDKVVDRATRFIHDHLQREITVAELATYVGYSTKQLLRLFVNVYGTTPLQYLLRVRMQTAATLLEQHPSMPIQEVAALVGMEPVYFSRIFKKINGTSPSGYRLGGK
ncbi:AraC family transcriptional regulator [Paenibacillus roseipurpureus]|uniref:AraC family transcriptional regulator n=1 Tax=Paenibacillus roseopurpureus TaxID=2918901 RepID=A0AA96RM46_9BACL|nr:AraC family transcriptional regulator [Paenibacillus sp. MBLB1832]WNR46086.1 AraC family transcriptional regulator [Paenibacillus sp. MBLB1832]